MREEIGDLPLMADANQVWDVDEAIEPALATTLMPSAPASAPAQPHTMSLPQR